MSVRRLSNNNLHTESEFTTDRTIPAPTNQTGPLKKKSTYFDIGDADGISRCSDDVFDLGILLSEK